ncbi:MAG: ATP-binding protein [Chloroflexota bacterium]|nr:MAG: ATP-binding protein [Chloroflexota bacterium]
MVTAEIMSLVTACRSFPDPPQPEITREHILLAIETIFEGQTDIGVIEGPEGIGKTILLSQFARRHPHNTFSLFIRPTGWWAYDPDHVRFDLCNQFSWALNQEEIRESTEVDDSYFRRASYHLARRAASRKERFYFVIDGLDQIPPEHAQFRRVILDMLPLGQKSFRFILSGDLSVLSADIPRGLEIKPQALSPFALDDTVKYFAGFDVDRQLIEEMYRTCKGNPGFLGSIRRLLQSGIDANTVADEMHRKLPRLFELEWAVVNSLDESHKLLLALLAHDPREHSATGLSTLLGQDVLQIRDFFRSLSFIALDVEKDSVRFISEPFRKFAAEQLKLLKQPANDLLINHLLQTPDSDDAIMYLPGYLQQSERLGEILSYLSPQFFTEMLERSQSLSVVQQRAELGVNAARQLGKDPDLMRFSLQQSVLAELDEVTLWRSEIAARMALNDRVSAVALAQGAVVRENRLHLLAIIARIETQDGSAPSPELVDNIRHLYQQLDPAVLGGKALEIATELIHSVPDLAIELVEKATSAGELDYAFALLAVVSTGNLREAESSEGLSEQLRSRIKDPKVLRLSTEASLV